MNELQRHGYRFVMVTNQDGLGTSSFPQADFDAAQDFVLEAFRSQQITFDAVLICPHRADAGCTCRKPGTALLEPYLKTHELDRSRSAVIGDRDSDMALAERLQLRGVRVQLGGGAGTSWPAVVQALLARHAEVKRETQETRIGVRVELDSAAPVRARTGIGFFDHMLEQLAKHGGFALELDCQGDLAVDEHHTVEDCALALGEALRAALADKRGLARYGFVLPMDETLAQVSVDLSGRPFAQFSGTFARESVGGLPTELVPHFFRSLSEGLRAAVHVQVGGENTHHMIESCFKGVGRSLRQAIRLEGTELPTTKGLL